MAPHARFGHVEKRDEGRWRARFTDPQGVRRSKTFSRKADANAWLSSQHTDILRREWRAPEAARVTVGHLADSYLSRPDLRESTRALYEGAWRLHLEPWWRDVLAADATPADVRRWHEERQRAGVGPTALVQAYRLLRALFRRAVKDEVILRSPVTLERAAAVKPARKRVALTVTQLVAAAESKAMPARYRAAVLVSGFGALRIGEWSELRRRDVEGARVTIERAVYKGVVGPPKTDAGVRVVVLPPPVAARLERHMREFVGPNEDALVFGTSAGTHLTTSNWTRIWKRVRVELGLPDGAVSHSMRHSGLTLLAQQGATTAELMRQAGHATSAAAMIYQHAADERLAELAERMGSVIPLDT